MINIEITYDWEAAKCAVSEDLLNSKILQTLRYKNEHPEAAEKYLPTQYFDVTGLRYHAVGRYAPEDIDTCIADMISLMTVWLAQKEVYGEITANNAFAEYKLGNHDT
jgi:hypothetical protein